MTFTLTTNYAWKKPDVGSETNIWGGDVNTNYDSQDTTVFTVSGVANAALPKAGGTMTGVQNVFTQTYATVNKGSGLTGAQTLDLSTANCFIVGVPAGALTITLVNVPATANVTVPIFIDITNGGASGVTWNLSGGGTLAKFPGGTPPVLSTSGNDLISFMTRDAGTTVKMVGFQKGLA